MKDEFGKIQKNYRTEFLGHSYTGEYVIDGIIVGRADEKQMPIDECLDEYCYGQDNVYGATHKLFVCIARDKERSVKYAYTELSMCVYGFWRII